MAVGHGPQERRAIRIRPAPALREREDRSGATSKEGDIESSVMN